MTDRERRNRDETARRASGSGRSRGRARSGKRSAGRDVSGIVLLDKPIAISSNDVLQLVKRLYQARKAGHTGSLDRLASGLLPLCLGSATKLSGFLLNADKRYVATIRLGVKTATGDAEGEVVDTRPVPELDEARVEQALAGFRGPIEQVPPMHSAIKLNGQRLYKLAHKGVTVERSARSVTIHRLDCLARGADWLDVEVVCSKGTYIRTLAEDIGEALGCGAHVAALRRTGSGPFDASQMVSLEQLEALAEQGLDALDAVLLGAETALSDRPEVDLNESMAFYIRQGQPVLVAHAPTSGIVRLTQSGRFIGVGEIIDDGRVAPRRLL
ncbi:MAG: tRNA pseudouridine(55) synthase TruB [Gammaproteobacteria bacterium]